MITNTITVEIQFDRELESATRATAAFAELLEEVLTGSKPSGKTRWGWWSARVCAVRPTTKAGEADLCGCDVDAGIGPCKWCHARGEKLLGALVRDGYGREWTVESVDEKNALVTIGGGAYWAYVDDVTVLKSASPPNSPL
jgi:hypothetical protein